MRYITAEKANSKEYIIDDVSSRVGTQPNIKDMLYDASPDVLYGLYEYKITDDCWDNLNKYKLQNNVYKLTKEKYHRILKKHNAERTTQRAIMENGCVELYNRGTKYVSLYSPYGKRRPKLSKYRDYYHFCAGSINNDVNKFLILAEDYPNNTLNEMFTPRLYEFVRINRPMKNTEKNIIYVLKKIHRLIEDERHDSDDVFYSYSAQKSYHAFKDDVSLDWE